MPLLPTRAAPPPPPPNTSSANSISKPINMPTIIRPFITNSIPKKKKAPPPPSKKNHTKSVNPDYVSLRKSDDELPQSNVNLLFQAFASPDALQTFSKPKRGRTPKSTVEEISLIDLETTGFKPACLDSSLIFQSPSLLDADNPNGLTPALLDLPVPVIDKSQPAPHLTSSAAIRDSAGSIFNNSFATKSISNISNLSKMLPASPASSKTNLASSSYSTNPSKLRRFWASEDFPAEQEGDLELRMGDEVYLLHEINKDWWYGRSGNKEGQFPATFVSVTKSPLQQQTNLFQALYTFDGNQEGELDFRVGDIILLLRKIDKDWWYGSCNGKEGLFPSSLVYHKNVDQNSKVWALFDFVGTNNELSFKKGDEITVFHRLNPEWLFGELNGVYGQFPSNYVHQIENRNNTIPPPLGLFVASYDFSLDQEGYLKLKKGDHVLVTECISDDWWHGIISPSGAAGIFPASYIQQLDS